MYNACSTTARRGALDWAPIFEKTNIPVFEKLYESVKNGTETRKSLEFNGRSTYRQDLAKELKEIDDQEIWRAGRRRLVFPLGCVLISFSRQGCPFPSSRPPIMMCSRLVCSIHLKSIIWMHCCILPFVSLLEIIIERHSTTYIDCAVSVHGLASSNDTCVDRVLLQSTKNEGTGCSTLPWPTEDDLWVRHAFVITDNLSRLM